MTAGPLRDPAAPATIVVGEHTMERTMAADEPELPDGKGFETDPLARIEALEARCNVLESVIAFLGHALAPDWEARMRTVHTLNQFEAEARKHNLHDDAIDTVRRIRLLIAGEEED